MFSKIAIYIFLFFVLYIIGYYIYKYKDKYKYLKVLMILFSSFIFAFGVKLLIQPSSLLAGGVGGLTLIISRVLTINLINKQYESLVYSIVYFLVSLPIFIIGFKGVGKKFTLLSLLNVLSYMLFMNIIPLELIQDLHLNEITSNLDIAIVAGIIVGVGISLAYLAGYSAGGSEILSMYLMKKKGSNVGNYSFFINFFVLLLGGIIFKDISSLLFTIVYIFVNSTTINYLYVRNKKVLIKIVSEKGHLIAEEISLNTKRFCSIIEARGAYSKERKQQINLVVSYEETKLIKDMILKIDPQSFINVIEVRALHGNFYSPPIV